jgi:hypothetical protein
MLLHKPTPERVRAIRNGFSQNFNIGLINSEKPYLIMPIRVFIKDTDKFPIQKCAIFRKFKDIGGIRGGILMYVAQAIPPDPVTSLA